MVDNLIEILIKFGLDKSKAEEAVRSIKEVSAAQKKASDDSEAYQRKLEEMFDREHAAREQQWKDAQATAEAQRKASEPIITENFNATAALNDYQQSLKQTAAESEKAASAKHRLKDALKGLTNQYPELKAASALALNPIAASVATIAAAFFIWKKNVQELTRSLGGLEMPDFNEEQISRIQRHAAAVGLLADNAAKLATNTAGIDKKLEAMNKAIAAAQEVNRIMGGEDAGQAEFAQAGATSRAAVEKRAQADALRQRGKTPGSAASEKARADEVAKMVAGATAQMQEVDARIEWLLQVQEKGNARRMLASPKFVSRYGFPNGRFNMDSDKDIASALEMERSNKASIQATLDRAQDFSNSAAGRQARRDVLSGADTIQADAAAMDAQAVDLRRAGYLKQLGAAQNRYNAAGQAVDDAEAAGNWGGMERAAREMDAAKKAVNQLIQIIREFGQHTVEQASKLKSESRNP